MNKLRWNIYIIWLSLKWINKTGLGDMVWYQGKRYRVANGVRCGMWRLHGLENGNDGWVPRQECKKVKSLQNYIGSFKSAYRFYMTSWFDIWVGQGIKDWMRQCNIWPK